jgi:hypothetical protein
MYQRGGEDLACVGIVIHDEGNNTPEIRQSGRITRRQSPTSVPHSSGVVEGE